MLLLAIECISCSCKICEQKEANVDKNAKDEKEDKKKEEDVIQGASSGEVTHVWVGTGAKVAPQQVENFLKLHQKSWTLFQVGQPPSLF